MSHKSRITATVERMPDRYTIHIILNYTNAKIKLHFVDESTKEKKEKKTQKNTFKNIGRYKHTNVFKF